MHSNRNEVLFKPEMSLNNSAAVISLAQQMRTLAVFVTNEEGVIHTNSGMELPDNTRDADIASFAYHLLGELGYAVDPEGDQLFSYSAWLDDVCIVGANDHSGFVGQVLADQFGDGSEIVQID